MEDEQQNKSGITPESTFKLTYYDYGQPFFGSYRGMRYRIARDPMVNVYGKSKEVKADGKLKVTVWPGPYSFENTEDDLKDSTEFPYSVEGKIEAVAWLNEQYETRKARWKRGLTILPDYIPTDTQQKKS